MQVDRSRARGAEGRAVAGTEDSYAAECGIDVELSHGTALGLIVRHVT